jgi:hypothetical protein
MLRHQEQQVDPDQCRNVEIGIKLSWIQWLPGLFPMFIEEQSLPAPCLPSAFCNNEVVYFFTQRFRSGRAAKTFFKYAPKY